VGVSILALATSLAARDAVRAAQNRIALTKATWRAEECAERARAAADAALSAPTDQGPQASAPWLVLDQVVAASPLVTAAACRVTLRAAGDALDVNDADGERVRGLLTAVGVPAAATDSLADALLDWRDADELPRPHGAERAWYDAQERHPPRNAPLADRRELRRVRGFEALMTAYPHADALLDVEPGRAVLDRGPLPVLASLPGVTDEVLGRITELRVRGQRVGDVDALSGALSQEARDALVARYADFGRLTTTEPDAWLLTSHATFGGSGTAFVEARLVRAGGRAALVRRRAGS